MSLREHKQLRLFALVLLLAAALWPRGAHDARTRGRGRTPAERVSTSSAIARLP